ncbi:hypothetical protein ABD86_04015 [Paenibacillus alvei]|uniref:hypothetical protein n=1 Tax=Paenibacillus alvei TaxID=44250 RepID=UPI000287E1A3|nr:hypothetical protein [Paenibacillus alvei]EJW14527.1 hypothetical protein PAV_13c01460 [Paenibacillus alvei DSM 29]MBG9734575.1 hypothetical protein [Paenibacillus alvei]MBG9743114.1 hypothetical protein [Paenibacillus alvei]MCY9586547.1 hypothetical protein [Paenibacillus alvei]
MKGGIFILNHDIFEIINRIDRLTQGYTSNLTRVIDQLNRINEAYSPVASALATAMEKNFLALSKVSDALLPVAKEWEAVTDFIREQDYSHLFITDSLSSKLNSLIESVEVELPDIKEEIIQTTALDINSSSNKKMDIGQFLTVLGIILTVVSMLQNQRIADESSIEAQRFHQVQIEQAERHHIERMEQAERHHRETMQDSGSNSSLHKESDKVLEDLISSIITELRSLLHSGNTSHSEDH